MITAILPAFKSRDHIVAVLKKIPPVVTKIIVVDDACPLKTGEHVYNSVQDTRITILFHQKNQGVGGAMITGYKEALKYSETIFVKIDSDGQMDPEDIPRLVKPIHAGHTDYCKGNRFFDLESLQTMPGIRIIGNSALSFINKASSGYWDIMDPTNGFTAIHRTVLERIPLDKLEKRYFFESDLLFRLNICRAKVTDVPMPAIYGEETSNLSVKNSIPVFLKKHSSRLLKRIFYTYFLRDFNAGSLLLISALTSITAGLIYGISNWLINASNMETTPTGTIIITAIVLLTGINLLISFVNYDITQKPADALHTLL